MLQLWPIDIILSKEYRTEIAQDVKYRNIMDGANVKPVP